MEVSRAEKYYAILKENGKMTGSVSHDMTRAQAIEYVEELAIFFNSG